MPTFCKVEKHVYDLIQEMVDKHHPDLAEAEVSYLCMYAYAGKGADGRPSGPALKRNGYPALAKVSIIPLRDRTAGMADARILLDGDKWEEHSKDRKLAILDHELEHIEVRRNEDGIMSDDIGRPKLKLRPHDFEVCGFHCIIERHSKAAVEAEAADLLYQELKQREFAFSEPAMSA